MPTAAAGARARSIAAASREPITPPASASARTSTPTTPTSAARTQAAAQSAAIAAARAKAAMTAAASASAAVSAALRGRGQQGSGASTPISAGSSTASSFSSAQAAATADFGARAPLRTPGVGSSYGAGGGEMSLREALASLALSAASTGAPTIARTLSATSLASDPYGNAGGFGVGASMPPRGDGAGSAGVIGAPASRGTGASTPGLSLTPSQAALSALESALHTLARAANSSGGGGGEVLTSAAPTGMPKVPSLGSLSNASDATWASQLPDHQQHPRGEAFPYTTGAARAPIHSVAGFPVSNSYSSSSSVSNIGRGLPTSVGPPVSSLGTANGIAFGSTANGIAFGSVSSSSSSSQFQHAGGGGTVSNSTSLLPPAVRSSGVTYGAAPLSTPGGASIAAALAERFAPGMPQASSAATSSKFPLMAQALARHGSLGKIAAPGSGAATPSTGASLSGQATPMAANGGAAKQAYATTSLQDILATAAARLQHQQ